MNAIWVNLSTVRLPPTREAAYTSTAFNCDARLNRIDDSYRDLRAEMKESQKDAQAQMQQGFKGITKALTIWRQEDGRPVVVDPAPGG